MYDILKNVILAGGYKLAEIQHKVKKLYAMGDLTDEQLDELMELSQLHASADGERPETMAMLRNLSDRLTVVEQKLSAGEIPPEGETDSNETGTGYKEWVQPIAGLTDDYQYGEILAHIGKLWRSEFKGQNVWEPGTPGTENIWVEITPEEEE